MAWQGFLPKMFNRKKEPSASCVQESSPKETTETIQVNYKFVVAVIGRQLATKGPMPSSSSLVLDDSIFELQD